MGVGKHLAASYPYSAGIGVGVVAYFGCKGILRPAILKWASAPRFLFCLCHRGAGVRNFDRMNEKLSSQTDENLIQSRNNQIKEKENKNRAGLTGFILALLGLLFCWVPGLNFLFWLMGLIFSIVGICKIPRVFAAVGIGITCISIWLVLLFSAAYIMTWTEYQDSNVLNKPDFGIMFGEERQEIKELEYVEIRGRKGNVSLYIGMPKDSVRMLVGKPGSVDLRTFIDETHEEWGYKIKNSYIEDLKIKFVDGKLERVEQMDY